MALLQPITVPDTRPAAPPRLRRCTFRRLMPVEAHAQPLYEVGCLYPGRQASIPLGDLETARPICNACQAGGVFRPDEE